MLALLVPSAFELFGMAAPPNLYFFNGMMGFVFVFGIGYIIVSRNIKENHSIVVLGGVIGKLIVFVNGVVAVSLGQANATVLGVVTIDLLFVILFVEFLNSMRKEIKPDFQ
jgi:uncharacterized membrane protein YdcZ (DUF606 family)